MAEEAERRARLCESLGKLEWWSQEQVTAWIGLSVQTVDRILKANASRIRTYSPGGAKRSCGRIS